MENKRLTRKLNSVFWWVLMVLPLIILLIVFISTIPQISKNFDWSNGDLALFIENYIDNTDNYEYIFNTFDNMSIPFIFNTFFQVFSRTFNISNSSLLAYLFGYMLSVHIYHLIFDFLSFIFDWLHNFFERG